MKNYEIEITGYGYEIAIGTLTQEQLISINNVMVKNNIETLEEFYMNYELTDEAGVEPWNETNYEFGLYSIDTSMANVVITDIDTDEEVLNKKLTDLTTFKNNEAKIEDIKVKTESLICSVNHEKGSFLYGEFEVDGVFDESKITVSPINLIVKDYDINLNLNLMEWIKYDGEEIYGDSSTQNKGFLITILDKKP